MSHNQDRLEELRAILAELEALGEPTEDLADELRQAELLEQALRAASQGAAAVEALPEPSPEDAQALRDPLRALHQLRAAAGGDQLDPARQEDLWRGIAAQLPATQELSGAKVIPLRRAPPAWTWFAAAAAIFLVVALAFLLPRLAPPGVSGPQVAQVELERAQTRLRELEAQSLSALMRDDLSLPAGDHRLRELRQARYEASQARHHAGARRL